MKQSETITQADISVKMVLDRWNASALNANTLLDSLSDETLMKEIAPGKNRGIYLLGHLIAVHDDMLILLDMGEKLYPELNEPFIKYADKASTEIPTVSELRLYLTKQNEIMKQKFEAFTTDDWFKKHTAVSAEDFVNEPHRNKLNIIITRTSHLQYHLGQLRLLK
ncbi:DinB family protein [Flavobacterium sp.]|uniref:DinB family protein n=1 Tax=Flavobacterium sp. TaxID=239 RepID=UPI00391BC083